MKKSLITCLVVLITGSSFAQDPFIREEKLVTVEPLGYIIKKTNIFLRRSCFDGFYCYLYGRPRCDVQSVQIILGGIPANISGEIEKTHEEKKAHKDALPFSHRNYENAITLNNTYIQPKPSDYIRFFYSPRYY